MADGAEVTLELNVAAMVAEMGPPTADDLPIAPDGMRLDTPDKVIAYLEQINAARDAATRQTCELTSSTPGASCGSSPTAASTA